VFTEARLRLSVPFRNMLDYFTARNWQILAQPPSWKVVPVGCWRLLILIHRIRNYSLYLGTISAISNLREQVMPWWQGTQLIWIKWLNRLINQLSNFMGFESRQGQVFSLLHVVQTGSGFHPTSCPMGTGGSFLGGKEVGTWSWLITSNYSEVKKMWIYICTPPYAFTA
jgi:hypothetical protein